MLKAKTRTVRTIWIGLIIVALSGLVYQTVAAVEDFLDSQPSTTYTVKDMESLELPFVDICPTAKFDSYKIKNLKFDTGIFPHVALFA